MAVYPICPTLVSRSSSDSSSSESSTPTEVDIDGLSTTLSQFSVSTESGKQQANDLIESFRSQLYLSLIPAGLLPKDAFTIDPRTGIVVLQKPTARTNSFLERLEALWQAANFAEDIALHYMELAVAERRGGELTTEDIETAIKRIEGSRSGSCS